MSDTTGNPVVGLFAFFFVLGIYFLPTIVAASREHHQKGAVFVINLLLGWTLVGWVVALAMAASAKKLPVIEQPEPSPYITTKTCPQCAETVKAPAKICHFCGYRFDTKTVPPKDTGAPGATVTPALGN